MATKLYIAADHGGFLLKDKVKAYLKDKSLAVEDLGCNSEESVDYPDFAHQLATKISQEKDSQGILICGTGIGMAMTANRHPGIRAALVTTPFMAKMAKAHNNANVLVLGGRVLEADKAIELVDTWLNETYEGGRHDRRLNKIDSPA